MEQYFDSVSLCYTSFPHKFIIIPIFPNHGSIVHKQAGSFLGPAGFLTTRTCSILA